MPLPPVSKALEALVKVFHDKQNPQAPAAEVVKVEQQVRLERIFLPCFSNEKNNKLAAMWVFIQHVLSFQIK